MDSVTPLLTELLGVGTEPSRVSGLHVAARTLVVFVFGVAVVRVGNKRFLGKSSAFDTLLAVMLGAVLGRAINGSAPLLPTLVGGAVLVGFHYSLAAVAFRSAAFDELVKGRKRQLIKDGKPDAEQMRRAHFNQTDLEESLRLKAKTEAVETVEAAYLERSGDVSVLRRSKAPQVLEVKVEAGVQTVRIRLE